MSGSDGGQRRRRPAGSPVGGQFAPLASRPGGIVLRDEPFPPVLVDAFEAAECGDSDELWDSVRHADPLVRAEAGTNPRLTEAQARVLVADEDWMVRWTMAQRGDLDAWAVLHGDADPRVRLAVAAGCDELTRRRLLADPDVAAISTLTGDCSERGGI